jgi:hypothetical protein
MLALLREVRLDAWAISQIRRPGTDVLRQITIGEVQDQTIRLIAIASLFFAGALSYFSVTYVGFAPVVIGLLCLSAAAQIWLGVVKIMRRRRIMRTLKLNRTKP